MPEKKTVTALIELATVALAIYAQERTSKADLYLRVWKTARWAAEKFGRAAIKAELKYHEEVSP